MYNNDARSHPRCWFASAFILLGAAVSTSAQGTAADDRAALEALYDSTDGANWTTNYGWKIAEELWDWYGVEVGFSGRVERLGLTNNQLAGEMPAELGNLTGLNSLSLNVNQLSGGIPAELGNLSVLSSLNLNNNQLSGEIPAELENLVSLQTLWLANNQLSGEIPAALGSLPLLSALRLDNNELSGKIPPELGNLTPAIVLSLQGNRLSGEIPAELGNLTSLTFLGLNDNELSGEIPAELGNLASLQELLIDATTGLCLAPDLDLTSAFAMLATEAGLAVCTTGPSGTPAPKEPAVVQMAVNDAIAAATNGEGLQTGGATVTVPLDALFTFPSSDASAVTYAGTTFTVSSTAPGVVSVSTTDVGPGVALTPGADAGTARVTVDARPQGQPDAVSASVMFEVEVHAAVPALPAAAAVILALLLSGIARMRRYRVLE